MRNRLLLITLLLLTFEWQTIMANALNAHHFTLPLLKGGELNLSLLKGKVLLITNTASKCRFTPQLKPLEQLYQKYKPYGFEVIAIPSNQFNNQEPLSDEGLITFFLNEQSSSYIITKKLTLHGPDANPFMFWLGNEAGILGRPKWNFYKYLIDRDGNFIDWFSSLTQPDSAKITQAIEKALKLE